jgi:hypothetical protein
MYGYQREIIAAARNPLSLVLAYVESQAKRASTTTWP